MESLGPSEKWAFYWMWRKIFFLTLSESQKKWLQTHTGWQSEHLNRFIRVLPKFTGIMWKQSWKSRAISEMGTLLLVKKFILFSSQETQKKWLETHTGCQSEELNRFICTLLKLTWNMWKLNGKSRAFTEINTLLIVKKSPLLLLRCWI